MKKIIIAIGLLLSFTAISAEIYEFEFVNKSDIPLSVIQDEYFIRLDVGTSYKIATDELPYTFVFIPRGNQKKGLIQVDLPKEGTWYIGEPLDEDGFPTLTHKEAADYFAAKAARAAKRAAQKKK